MLGISDYGAFSATFVLLLFLPGPGNLALITSTTMGGVMGGMASMMGLLMGDQILLWLTVAGVAAMLKAHPSFFMAVQYMGAAYLVCLGYKMIMAKSGAGPSMKITLGHYFRETLLITLLNPKAILFYLAFFPQFIDPVQHLGWVTFAVMAATIASLGLVYCVGVVWVTHQMAERIQTRPRLASFFQKLAGASLMGFGLKMLMVK
jgi:threonine/homoserine/homoserine lactone efflux protein